METLHKSASRESQAGPPRLRAMVEIIDGRLKIFPVASSDVEASQILDALRFFGEDVGDR